MVVNLLPLAQGFQSALVDDRDPVAHDKRFFLVVGDVDERNAKLLLVAADFDLHLLPQLAVKVCERLIEQK